MRAMTTASDIEADQARGDQAPAGKANPWPRRALIASVATAATLTLMKAAVWFLSGSVALLSALADSAIDLVASGGALLAIVYAHRPRDAEHRFGHDKAEAVAGLAQGTAILASAVFVTVEAARLLFDPAPVKAAPLVLAVGVVSIAVTGALIAFQSFAARRSRSLVLDADRLHYVGDVVLNAGVVAAAALAAYGGFRWADPLFGLAAAAWLARGARRILRGAMDQLLDRELDPEWRAEVVAIAESVPGAHKVRALRTRQAGAWSHIVFHLDMDPDITLLTSHHIALEAERRIRARFDKVDVVIHPDPLGWSADHPEAMDLEGREPKPLS